MQNLAKTIILNNNSDKNFIAILNLRQNDFSKIKFFNLNNVSKNYALGIKQNSNVIKIPLNINNNDCVFKIDNKIDFNCNLTCAIVDVSNPFCPEIILSGSENTRMENSRIEGAFVVKKPQDTSVLYEKDSQESIENLIDRNLQDDMNTTYFDSCANCKYREAFYNEGCSCSNKANVASTKSKFLENDLKEEKEEDYNEQNNENSFYNQVKAQVEALFAKYEQYSLLESIIPNSRWSKIVYDKNGDYYVLGLIYNDIGEVLYICYGMPASSPDIPPEDLEEYAGWFPKDSNNPNGEGYFIVCQDAKTGKTVKLDLL